MGFSQASAPQALQATCSENLYLPLLRGSCRRDRNHGSDWRHRFPLAAQLLQPRDHVQPGCDRVLPGLDLQSAISGNTGNAPSAVSPQWPLVQSSTSTNGLCTDAGSTYPTSNRVVGIALSSSNVGPTGTSQTIYLFGAEVRGTSGSGGRRCDRRYWFDRVYWCDRRYRFGWLGIGGPYSKRRKRQRSGYLPATASAPPDLCRSWFPLTTGPRVNRRESPTTPPVTGMNSSASRRAAQHPA